MDGVVILQPCRGLRTSPPSNRSCTRPRNCAPAISVSLYPACRMRGGVPPPRVRPSWLRCRRAVPRHRAPRSDQQDDRVRIIACDCQMFENQPCPGDESETQVQRKAREMIPRTFGVVRVNCQAVRRGLPLLNHFLIADTLWQLTEPLVPCRCCRVDRTFSSHGGVLSVVANQLTATW